MNILKDKEVLLILDNTEDPLENDRLGFVSELESIIDHLKSLKVLITSRKSLGKLSFHNEKPYVLTQLTQDSSLKLLISKAPREIKPREIQELLSTPIPSSGKIKQGFNFLHSLGTMKPKTLLDHPFTLLLGGHPQAITLAAPMLEYKSLLELFL